MTGAAVDPLSSAASMRARIVDVVALACGLGLWLAPLDEAQAQIVNVQGALAKEPEPGWSGSAQLSVDWQTGNRSIVRVAGAGTLLYHCGPWTALALARAEYSEGEGVKLAEKTFEHLRARRALGARWLWEAFAQHEYDAFRRLAVRGVVGSGPALRLVDRSRGAVTTGLAYLLELEQRSVLADAADSGLRRWHHRLSAYLTGNLALGAQVTGTQTVYVQPRLDAPDDVTLLSETSVQSQLGARFTLINSLVITYDASPPETVATLTTSLKVGVAVTF